MLVRDFMIKDPITAPPTTTIKELLNMLVQHHIGGVPVVDSQNKLLGMVSDGDILRYLAPRESLIHDLFFTVYIEQGEKEIEVLKQKIDTPIEKVMHRKQLFTVRDDDIFEDAVRTLSQHHFKKIPVLNWENEVIGVISRGDIIHNLAKMITKV